MPQPSPAPPVCHALEPGPRGVRLPVIDVTHPAFALRLTQEQWTARIEAHRRFEARRRARPRWMRRLIYWLFLRNSDFVRRLRAADGGFLDGMSTYRLKLGPANLAPAWSSAIDRRIADSLPCLSLRLRLQDMAELLADDLAPRLAAHPGRPLVLVNIAGGPSSDSLNALLVLRQRDPALLRARPVAIHLFDQDEVGPTFAARSLAALQADGAPLAGLAIDLTHHSYRWDAPATLRTVLTRLPAGIVAAASSEGGLFNYGSDDEVSANLAVLRDELPPDTGIAGTLSLPRTETQESPLGLNFKLHRREVGDFSHLVAALGWRLVQHRRRPYQIDFLLRQTTPAGGSA